MGDRTLGSLSLASDPAKVPVEEQMGGIIGRKLLRSEL